MASELLREMLRNADPDVLSALDVSHTGGDAGTDSGADHHHGLDLIPDAAGALSIVLLGRTAWKEARQHLNRRKQKQESGTQSDDTVRPGDGTGGGGKGGNAGGSASGTGTPDKISTITSPQPVRPRRSLVIDFARQSVADHFEINDPETLTLVFEEYDEPLSAWRFDFTDLSGTTYNVAVKTQGSKAAAVNFNSSRS
ncbi:hypothetical protein [Streptomyces sp. NPDC051014]|uniref:hypothetical protein n=1 Tax=Streptomyces sp. NPDC051014 TaxID=3155751 RepID=UPI0033CBADD4